MLRHEVRAFDFLPEDFNPLIEQLPEIELVHHDTADTLLPVLSDVERLLCWNFEGDWYRQAGCLKLISTPAAGYDWIARPQEGEASIHHGTFHGPMMAESLLGALLYTSRRIPALEERQRQQAWDRDIQADTRLLKNQTCLLIGYGEIGVHCARLLRLLGTRVLGYRRSRQQGMDDAGVHLVSDTGLNEALSAADHVVLLLPGGEETRRFMTPQRLGAMKTGSYIYNFGRGNSLLEADLLPFLDAGQIAGAVLDVVENEPLPSDSGFWAHPGILVMPHSSCVYSEYKQLYLKEVSRILEATS